MANLFESMTYAIPGFAQGMIQGKQLMGKDEDREIKRRQLGLEERKLKLLEDEKQEALRQKTAQQQAERQIRQLLEEVEPTSVAPTDISDLATGGVPMQPTGAGGMQIPGKPISQSRLMGLMMQASPKEGIEMVGRQAGLGKPGEGMMSTPYGVFNAQTGQFQTPQGQQQGPPSQPPPEGMQWAPAQDAYGRTAYRAVPMPRKEKPRSITEAELLILKDLPEDQRLPNFPDYSPSQARKALTGKAEQRGEEAGARTEESLKQQGKLIDIIEKITHTKSGAGERGRFEASLDEPITPAEAILYRLPAGTTRRELLAQNPHPVTEADIDAGTQFEAAKAMLEEYKDVAGRLLTAKDATGSLGQRARLAFGAFVRTDEDAVRLRALQATVPLLVRALGEKGTLASADVQRALDAVPDFADTQQTAQAKIAQLEKFIATVEKQIKELRPGLQGRGAARPGAAPAPAPGGAAGPKTQGLREKYGY